MEQITKYLFEMDEELIRKLDAEELGFQYIEVAEIPEKEEL